MARVVPWNIDGVDFDAREAAKAAARRAGMSLGEWLNGVITERATDLGVGADEIDEDGRLEAVTARLASLSKQRGTNPPRPVSRSERGSQSVRRRSMRRDDAGWPDDEERFEKTRAYSAEDDSDRQTSSFDPEQLLDRAVTAFDQRARVANERMSAALDKVSRRLAEIDTRIEAAAKSDGEPVSKELLSRLEARLDRMTRHSAAHDVSGKLGELDRKLALIANRLEQAEATTSAAERPEDFARIETKLNRLSETIDRAVYVQPHPVGSRRNRLARRSIADAVAEITERQAALDPDMRPASALHHGNDLRADLAALSERLDDMRHDAVVRDEQQFRTINEKIESLGAQRPDIATLARIRAQTEEIRNLLAAAATRPMPIENIEGQIAALAQRLDSIASLGPSPAALAQVDSQLAEIRAALERPVSEPALQQIENRIESLTQRVEQALSNTPGSSQFDELAQRLDFVHRSLVARMERPVAAIDTVAFEGMMRDIVGKLAQPSRAANSQPQLENLLSRLADRLETPEPTARLEELVRDLAERIDTAAPIADQRALDSLQQQIARLAQRLDQTDSNAGVLGSLERKISDLFEGLEQTRQTAIDAAEIAARTAAQDAVREVGLVSSSKSRASEEDQSEHVTRELADLRSVQAAADRQTHATLTAVHETLEKVVDRLAMLEDEIGDVRKTAVEQPFASGPPPVFAPSRPRGGGSGAGELESRLDDRDFLIEPGSGFAPERRSSDGSNKPPFPPESKPPVGPSSTPSSPQSGSTQANFIAAARRTIQAKAENSDQASHLRPMGALDGALADARTRARAAAAALMDDADPRQKPEKERGPGALARASAFFAGRKRPLVLGLAGVVVTLCALELVHNQTAPHVVAIDETAIPVPAKPAAVGVARPASPPSSLSDAGQVTTGQPSAFGNSAPTDAVPAPSPEKTSSAATPGVDLSPVGAIATKPAAPPILAVASLPGSPDSAVASDLPAVRDLAGRGNAAAQFELGVRYAEGRTLPRDLKLAAQWLEKSAQQNNAPAQYRLATLYEKGLGVTRDANVAINWYRRAANAGNIRAMHNLAVMIAENGDGKPDYDDAAIWFRKAAEYGVRDSQYNLAILYARGLGVQKDLSQSYIWFSLAAAQGDSDSTSKRDEIAAHLEAKQLADAKAIIDAFKPQSGSAAANDVDPPPHGWSSLIATPAPTAKTPAKAKVSAL